MPTSVGPNTFGEENLVFGYDTGDTVNSYKGEPTVNILSTYVNPTFENGSTSGDGWAIDGKTDGSYTYHSADSYSGTYSVKLTNSTVSAIAFWRIDIPVVSGTQYTVSVYAKNIDCPTTPYFSGVNISGGGHSFTGISTTEWKRFSKTYTASSTGNAQFYIRTNNDATQGSFLIDNFQIEQKPHATPFVNGTRSATQGLIDLTSNSTIDLTNVSFDSDAQMEFDGTDDYFNSSITAGTAFTIETVINRQSTPVDPYEAFLWAQSGNGSDRISIDSNLALRWRIRDSAGNYSNKTSDVNYVTLNENCHIMITIEGSTVKYFKSGVLTDTFTDLTFYSDFGGSILIGRNSTNGQYFDGKIPMMKIYNRALTASEIKANYNAIKGRFNI